MKRIISTIVLLCIVLYKTSSAQEGKLDSLNSMVDNRVFDEYGLTGNAAAIAASGQSDHGFASAHFGRLYGDFKRPMEPGSSSTTALSTGGLRRIGNWRVIAHFQYRKTYDNNVAWAAINEPYRGNPFIWADSSSGKWDRDHANASLGITRIVSEKLQAGIVVDYAVGTGARTTEPKPFYRNRNIFLRPGIIWKLSPSSDIGFAGQAGFIQEENEIGYFSNNNVLLYRLRGYGTFSKSPFVSGERKNKGTEWKGMLNYHKHFPNYDLVLSATAAQRDEEVREGIAQTNTIGYFSQIIVGGQLYLLKGTSKNGKSLHIVYENENGYADDMVFRAENGTSRGHVLQATASGWKSLSRSGDILQWNLSPSFRYIDYLDRATSMEFAVSRLGGSMEVNWRKQLNRQHQLRLQPTIGYYHVVDDALTVRRRNTIIHHLIVPDYEYFSTSFWKPACLLSLQISPERTRHTHVITALANAVIVKSNRTYFQVQYTIIF